MLSRAIRHFRNYGMGQLLRAIMFRTMQRPIRGRGKYVACVDGLYGLEVGGPSAVFQPSGSIPLYDRVGALDNCNYGPETVWEGKLSAGKTFSFSTKAPPPGNSIPS